MENEKQKILVLDQYLDGSMSVYYFIVEVYHFEEKISSYFVLENNTKCWTDDITEATKFTSKDEAKRDFLKYYDNYLRESKIKGESYTLVDFEEVTDKNKIQKGDFAFVIRSVLEIFLEKENITVYIKNCTNKTASFYNILATSNREDFLLYLRQ